jgi:hypothetical protein
MTDSAHTTPIASLAARIAAYPTATEALQLWCERRHPLPGATVQARVLTDRPTADSDWRYRQVQLVWGELILSDAENWYLPHRLPAPMRDQLRTTPIPFGVVVRPLHPRRVTIGIATSHQFGHTDPQAAILHIRALVTTSALGIIAETSEHYRSALIV